MRHLPCGSCALGRPMRRAPLWLQHRILQAVASSPLSCCVFSSTGGTVQMRPRRGVQARPSTPRFRWDTQRRGRGGGREGELLRDPYLRRLQPKRQRILVVVTGVQMLPFSPGVVFVQNPCASITTQACRPSMEGLRCTHYTPFKRVPERASRPRPPCCPCSAMPTASRATGQRAMPPARQNCRLGRRMRLETSLPQRQHLEMGARRWTAKPRGRRWVADG